MKHTKNDEKGLKKKDFEKGQNNLEMFKVKDKLEYDTTVRQAVIASKREHLAFEKDLIIHAQAYTVDASKRLTAADGERKTYRQSMAEIYADMSKKHSNVINEKYKLETYGMKIGSETHKKAYPENFKRYFFHLIKTLNGKAPGKMSRTQCYKQSRKLPTTFMVAGNPNSTHNKKIVMTSNLAKRNVNNTMATRTRVFYREDFKKKMPGIFMSQDDQINCRFEPIAGSLNPDFWRMPSAVPEKLLEVVETEEAFRKKHGENLKLTHPEVFKKGILKKATRLFNEGDFKTAESTLMTGFKLRSLR